PRRVPGPATREQAALKVQPECKQRGRVRIEPQSRGERRRQGGRMSQAGRTLSQPFVPDLDRAPRRWWLRPALWIRVAVMAFAAFALSSQVAGGWGTRAAVIGAIVGVLFGQRLGGGR